MICFPPKSPWYVDPVAAVILLPLLVIRDLGRLEGRIEVSYRPLVQSAALHEPLEHSSPRTSLAVTKQSSSLVSLLSLPLVSPHLPGLPLQGNHPQVEEPDLAPGDDEGEQHQHHVVSERLVFAELELENLRDQEGDCAGGGEGDDPPVGDVEDTVEHQAEGEPAAGRHHAVKHGAPYVVVNHLTV